MYSSAEVEKKERRKIIIAATISVAIILLLIVAIIVVATKKSSRTNISKAENSTFELSDSLALGSNVQSTTESKTVNENDSDLNTASVEQESSAKETETEIAASSEESSAKEEIFTNEVSTQEEIFETADELPATGSEEIFPIALMLGALVMYLSSRALAKREA